MGFTFSENKIKFYNDSGELCCFECGSTEEIQMHHIVPKSRGGEKMISICYCCHQKAHHKKAKSVKHGQLISEGIAKARANGLKWNNLSNSARKKGWSTLAEKSKAKRAELCPTIDKMRKEGKTWQNISDSLNEQGILTPRGKKWCKQGAVRLYQKWLKDQKSS